MLSITLQEYSNESFIIKGDDTIKFKDTLKEFGGKWHSVLSGWIFPNTHKTKLQKFLEVINIQVKGGSAVKEVSKGVLLIKDYTEKSFVLHGDTQPHKDKIKELGGKWNANLKDGLKGWIFPMTKKKTVEDFIKNAKALSIDVEEEIYYEAEDDGDIPIVSLLKK